MTSIYREIWPIAHLIDRDGLSLVYESSWESRASAFPMLLFMPSRSGLYCADQIMPWLANLQPETHLSETGLQLKIWSQDIVGLLMYLGRDTAGAFSIREWGRERNNFPVHYSSWAISYAISTHL